MENLYKDEVLQLLYFDQDQKLVLNDDAVKVIESIKGPIGVIGIAGSYRTGKSFLINRVVLNR